MSNQQIILADFYHLYSTLLHRLNIEYILWIGSYRSPFFTILLEYSTIKFLTVDSSLSNPRVSLYTHSDRSKVSYIYLETGGTILETIKYFNNVIIFTPSYCNYKGYASLPLTPTLFCMIPSSSTLSIEYLHSVGRAYNFNASVCLINGQPLYSIRSSDSKFTHSDLELLYGLNRTSIPYTNICREDVRLFTWKGSIYGSYTCITPYIAGVRTNNTLTVGRFEHCNNEIRLVEEIVPSYGGNLTNMSEKNWTWWESPSGRLHCAYTFTPFRLLEFTDLSKPPTDITDKNTKLPDLIRGGACGYIHDGKVWCFTHTSLTEDKSGCFFNIGVVVLSHTEVPRVLGYCNTLVASKDYMNIFFYICGAYFDSAAQSWKLTGGVQDSKACIITIPHEEVLIKTGLNT